MLSTDHALIAGHLRGTLTDEEEARLDAHLGACPSCREELEAFEPLVAALRVTRPDTPPVKLERQVLDAVAAAPTPITAAPSRRRRTVLVAVAASILALAVGFGAARALDDDAQPGTPELDVTLMAANGRQATADVTFVGEGRVITFRTDELPVLPKNEFYELWFVGPGDAPGALNRVSAGTFHPDEDGNTDVRLTAAVDPELYPVLAVTMEPADGNPLPAGGDILRSD